MADPKDQVDDDPELDLEDGPDDLEDDGADGAERDDEDEGEGDESDDEEQDTAAGDKKAAADEEEGEDDEPPPRRRSAREVREIADRAADVERRERALQEADSRKAQETAQQEAQREQELLASMDDGQKTTYLMAKELMGLKKAVQNQEISTFDRADKAEFETKYASQPRFKKFSSEVERGYQELRKQGTNISRVAVLDYLIGKSIREGGAAAHQKQRRAGAKRIAEARGKGGGGRSDVGGGGRSGRSVVNRAENEDWAI